MPDIEVHIDLDGRPRQIGLVRRNIVRGAETMVFECAAGWLADPDRFSVEPALALTRGAFAPPAGRSMFGSLGDSAPDTWGRRLMQRAERRQAVRQGRAVRTLAESEYLLGVADETRLGALRFRWVGDDVFQAPARAGVPSLIELGRLLEVTQRVLRDEETDEDLQVIFAPGSSLGGARPKASVIDRHGQLSIAKFPKETDDYSMETWEEIALRLAARGSRRHRHASPRTSAGRRKGGVAVSSLRSHGSGAHPLPLGDGDDRIEGWRTRQLSGNRRRAHPTRRPGADRCRSALPSRRLQRAHIERGRSFAQPRLSVARQNGLVAVPGLDLNPTPTDLEARVLTTNIDLDEGTCSIDLLEAAAQYFGLGSTSARTIIKSVAIATATWRDVAEEVGARAAEITRMVSAFEHDDLERAWAL